MTDKHHSIYILGCQSSGKSSFLAGLGIVSEPDRDIPIQFICKEEERGQASALANRLRDGHWPAQTTESRFIYGTLRFNHHDISVRWLDYSGERFVRHFTEGGTQFGDMPKELLEANYYLLALDPEVDLADERGFETREDKKGRKIHLQALITAAGDFRLKRGNQRPMSIAALITKADKIGQRLTTPQDAEAYLQQTAPTLLNTLRGQFPNMPIFAVSAVGHTETTAPGEIPRPGPTLEPWGYENIFAWIVNDINAKRRNRRIKRVLPALAAILTIGFAWWGWEMWRQISAEARLRQLARGVLSEEERTEMANLLPQTSETARNAIIDDILAQVERTLDNPSAQAADYDDALVRLGPVIKGGGGYRIQDIESLRVKLHAKIEDARYLAIQRAFETKDPSFMGLALEYLASFPTGRYKDEVDERVREHQQNVLQHEISKLVSMRASSAQGLRNIALGLTEFVANHPDKALPAMRDATRLAIRLADEVDQQALTVELRHLGNIVHGEGGAHFQFRIFLGADEIYNETSDSEVKTYSFEEKKELKIPWKPGDTIGLQAYLDWGVGYGNDRVAEKEILGLLAIAELDGEVILDESNEDVQYFEQAKVILTADVKGWEPEDWQLLKDWVIEKTALSTLAGQT